MINKPYIYLILLLLVSALFSYLREVPDINLKVVNYGYWLCNTFTIFGWCLAHAKQSEFELPFLKAILCGLVPPVGVPVYFYSSFGFKTGSLKLFLTLLYFFLLITVSVIFEMIGERNAL